MPNTLVMILDSDMPHTIENVLFPNLFAFTAVGKARAASSGSSKVFKLIIQICLL